MEGAASAGQILLSPALAETLPRANRGRPLGPGILLGGSPPEPDRTEVHREAATIDLESFVPLALRETVLAGEVEPEHRSVTIAFVHYGGFDELVAREGADAAASALDALVRATQQAVDAHGVAFLASDIAPDGGKLILTAGAPVVTGSDEEQMLLSVRAIVGGGSRLPLHVGVNKGPVFAGAIGPPYRQTYTVMGDAVNLAARLMAKAGTGEIVATPHVLDASRTIFETTELEPFLVKGKKKPITAFTVGEAKGSRTTIAEAGLPLLGRDEELATLLGAWEAARGGEGRVVEISAEPGMGKSRLLDEFLARTEGARVIHGECRLYQSATPYFPFRALLRAAFALEGLDPAATAEALVRLVDEQAPALLPWLSLIGTPLDLELAPSPEVEALEDEFRRARLEEAVASLTAQVAQEPAVVVVEDTHWMDEASRDLLTRVTESLRSSPWFVVLTRRPGAEGYAAVGDGDALVRIELEPLGPEPVVALIHAATEDAPLRPQQERELAERAAGNPLFLIELLDALRRGEDVESMPSSVEGLIQARIDSLPTGDRRRLRALSVLGVGFRVEHATATLGVADAADVGQALRPLGEFVSVDATGWAEFRHALIRDAAYEGLPYRRRQDLHAQVGDSILRAAGDHPEEQAGLLAVHFWHARRWDETWRFSRVAGDRARDVYANLEAARYYERALGAAHRLEGLDQVEQARVAMRLGEAREFAGMFEPALEVLRRARRLAEGDPLVLAALHERRARILTRMGAYVRALREAMRGLRVVEGIDGVEAAKARASLSAVAASVRLYQGRPAEALPLALRGVREAESTGEPGELGLAYSLLNDVYIDLGRGDEAVFADRAIELFSSVGRLQGVGSVETSVGVRAYAEGRWGDAVAAYLRAQEAFGQTGDEAQAALAAANIGEVLVSQGRYEEAAPALREAARVLRAHGSLGPALFAEIQVGRLQLGSGELERAVETLTRVRDEAASVGMASLALDCGVNLATALAGIGEGERALGVLDEEEQRVGAYASYFASALARARGATLLSLGRLDEAAVVIAAGIAAAREQDALYDEAQLLVLRSEVALRLRASDATEALEEADRLLQRLGVVDVAVLV